MTPELPTFDDRALAIDAATVASVSAAICVAANSLVFMSVFVPLVLVVRLIVISRRSRAARATSMATELAFFGLCVVLGAYNDWNSVVRHGIYAYDVPHWFPQLTTIPLWMLLFWGMLLRFFFTLSRWRRLDPPARAQDEIGLGPWRRSSAWLKVVVLLTIVAVTRQLIYRHFADPIWSWVPFALGLILYAVVVWPTRHDRCLVALFLVGGPVVEILYIEVGHLHHYALGWIAGVPVWIALWWVLAILIWKDVGARAFALIQRVWPEAELEAVAAQAERS